jgi:predicted hotdog family 3-hydroxylacyl-ACP dehydratase
MIEKNELLSVVPHRGRMLLLSKVNKYDLKEETVEAEYHITEDCLFYDPSIAGVPAWVGFEFIAQAISAYSGIKDREMGLPSKIGFILSVSQMEIGLSFFETGSILVIRTKEIECMDPLYIYKGEIFFQDKKVLEGKITVMKLDNEEGKQLK